VPKIRFGVERRTGGVRSLPDDRSAQAVACRSGFAVESRAELEAEILILRQQVNVLLRRMPKRPALTNIDRLVFVWLYRWFPSTVDALAIVRPETIIRWHRLGFRAYWRRRSRHRVGRPNVSVELRALIREMSRPNPLWGAPRIHGELLKPNRRWLSLPRTKSNNIGDDAHEDRARDKLADPLDRDEPGHPCPETGAFGARRSRQHRL
jgi:hypothetical protein